MAMTRTASLPFVRRPEFRVYGLRFVQGGIFPNILGCSGHIRRMHLHSAKAEVQG